MKHTFKAEKNEYTFKTTTTQEHLEMQVTAGDGMVCKYGDHILMADPTGREDLSRASTSSSRRRRRPGFANANAA